MIKLKEMLKKAKAAVQRLNPATRKVEKAIKKVEMAEAAIEGMCDAFYKIYRVKDNERYYTALRNYYKQLEKSGMRQYYDKELGELEMRVRAYKFRPDCRSRLEDFFASSVHKKDTISSMMEMPKNVKQYFVEKAKSYAKAFTWLRKSSYKVSPKKKASSEYISKEEYAMCLKSYGDVLEVLKRKGLLEGCFEIDYKLSKFEPARGLTKEEFDELCKNYGIALEILKKNSLLDERLKKEYEV